MTCDQQPGLTPAEWRLVGARLGRCRCLKGQ